MKQLFIDILIRLLKVEHRVDAMPKEIEDGLLSQMWENPAFRKHIAERDKKIIYQMAGGEGLAPEPREQYVIHSGQRVENLLLARDAKAAFERTQKARQAKPDTLRKE